MKVLFRFIVSTIPILQRQPTDLKKQLISGAPFLMESLIDLGADLRALGSGLLILKGKPEIEIPKMVNQYKAPKVYAKREVAFEEKRTETLVQSELWKRHCEVVFSVSRFLCPIILRETF